MTFFQFKYNCWLMLMLLLSAYYCSSLPAGREAASLPSLSITHARHRCNHTARPGIYALVSYSLQSVCKRINSESIDKINILSGKGWSTSYIIKILDPRPHSSPLWLHLILMVWTPLVYDYKFHVIKCHPEYERKHLSISHAPIVKYVTTC